MVVARGDGSAAQEDALGKGARWLLFTALIAALVAGGAWWLLREQTESAALRLRHAAAADVIDAKPPAATDTPALPAPATTANAEPLAVPSPAAAVPSVGADAPPVITGRVVDQYGRAVAGAFVRHVPTAWQCKKLELRYDALAPPLDLSRLAGTQTTGDGGFRLAVTDHVPDHDGRPWAGSSEDVPRLLVLHPGFEARVVGCAGWRGGDFDAGDIVLADGAVVSGRAVDERGLPLAEVSVGVPAFDDDVDEARLGDWYLVRATLHDTTGTDGRFVLDGFWVGPHRLELRVPGHSLTQHEFVVEPGRPLDLGDIALSRGGVIEGVVVDALGRPVPGAELMARPSSVLEWLERQGDVDAQMKLRTSGPGGVDSIVDVEGTADERGAFRFDSLDATYAPYRIYAAAPGFEPVRSEDVSLDAAPLRLQLSVAASLLLTVVDPISHERVVGAQVTAERLSGAGGMNSQALRVSAEPEALAAAGLAAPFTGTFLIGPAGSEKNHATVSAPGRAMQEVDLPGVPPGERRSVIVELPLALHIAGRVLDAHEEPIAEAKLSIIAAVQPPQNRWPPDPPVELASARSGVDGAFTLESLAAGDLVLRAAASGFVPLRTPTITLATGAPIDGLELVLQPAGTLAGVVLAGETPVKGMLVRAWTVAQGEAVRAAERAHGGSVRMDERPEREDHETRTDAEGRFRFEDLSPEPFEVSGPPGVNVVADVRAGQTTEITLLQRGRPRVRGRVTDAKGPVSGATVSADRYLEIFKGWANGGPSVHTDPDGNFDLELEDAGRYRVGAKLGKLRGAGPEMELTWDQVESVDVQLMEGKPASGG
jgi:protocatechuate 3,4-dioxygenase beta subunit